MSKIANCKHCGPSTSKACKTCKVNVRGAHCSKCPKK